MSEGFPKTHNVPLDDRNQRVCTDKVRVSLTVWGWCHPGHVQTCLNCKCLACCAQVLGLGQHGMALP